VSGDLAATDGQGHYRGQYAGRIKPARLDTKGKNLPLCACLPVSCNLHGWKVSRPNDLAASSSVTRRIASRRPKPVDGSRTMDSTVAAHVGGHTSSLLSGPYHICHEAFSPSPRRGRGRNLVRWERQITRFDGRDVLCRVCTTEATRSSTRRGSIQLFYDVFLASPHSAGIFGVELEGEDAWERRPLSSPVCNQTRARRPKFPTSSCFFAKNMYLTMIPCRTQAACRLQKPAPLPTACSSSDSGLGLKATWCSAGPQS
jgi:hypothetical protein